MNFEDLKNIKPTRTTHGRPSYNLTDKKWQTEFELMKLYVKPYPKHITRMSSTYLMDITSKDENGENKYDGKTNWQSYCAYINDVLTELKLGHVDYCYFGYQIHQLLKFHHDALRTKYCDGYWKVWLEC